MKLVVTKPFGNYAVGDQITAPQDIEAAVADNPHSVVRVATDEAPAVAGGKSVK